MRRQGEAGQYPRLSPVQAVARALGCTEATARQVLNPADPRNPWFRAGLATEGLLNAGHVSIAERRCRRIDEARQPRPLFVSEDTFRAALEAEQRTDGDEDCAELFIVDAASFRTWERRALRHVDQLFAALRLGRALYGVA